MQENPVVTQAFLVANLARMSDIHTRIKALRLGLGLSMEQLASQVGVKAWQTVQQWEQPGGTAPKRARLDAVAKALRTTSEYLMTGVEVDVGASSDAHLPVQMVDAKASAGEGHLVVSHDVSTVLMFRRDWLAKYGVRNAADALTFQVVGDSMVDACIPHESVVLANRRRTDPEPKGIYVLWLGGQLYVKRLVQERGRWFARSCNTARAEDLPDIAVEADDRIEGRVFWCGFGL